MLKYMFVVIMLFLVGCATPMAVLEKTAIDDVVEAERIHNEAIRNLMEMDKENLKIMPYEIGLIRGILGKDIERLPAEVINTLDEIEMMVTKDKLTLAEKGEVRGAYTRVRNQIILILGEQIAQQLWITIRPFL